MERLAVRAGALSVIVTADGTVSVAVHGWPGLNLGPLGAQVTTDRGAAVLSAARAHAMSGGAVEMVNSFDGGEIVLRRVVSADAEAVTVSSSLTNLAEVPVRLAEARLLAARRAVALGSDVGAVRLYEQGGYWARVRRLGEQKVAQAASGEQDASQKAHASDSQYVWVAYDSRCRMALLAGFETGERWTGHIRTESAPGAMPSGWSMRFDGGQTLVEPGQTVTLESVSLAAGPDPWALLCAYGDRVAARHGVRPLADPPVSWCSWYPYRLGVSEDRALATAQIAAERLRPLGLRIVEIDLGWEKQWLPSAFDENDQFPNGLRALCDKLEQLGFVLGAWKAPFTISAHDPLAKEHPEWLLRGQGDAGPRSTGEWYWEPHGDTYALDLTHPGALEWLRMRMRSLAERGVRYFKPDFIGGVTASHLTDRHNPEMVAGGGAEAIRAGMRVIVEELTREHGDALALNCGGPDMPGAGAFPLLYTCNDTGNTGFVGWKHLEEDYGRYVAGHLWKNRRWGILQPSCLVVGLPGSLEEARLRATATFLTGGQVDISDDLTTLPEDRWHALLATLPPLGRTATPVDLFEPISVSSIAYDALASGRGGDAEARTATDASRVWTLEVDGGWDQWTLVGLFNYDTNDDVDYGKALITRFQLPVARLGLDPGAACCAFEFWSSQYLGVSPFGRPNPHGYRHPGDAQGLISCPEPGTWEVAFFGPGVKLLAVRRARTHPWPVGTTFHQSCGTELADVEWGGDVLRGVVRRPGGHVGSVVVASDRGMPRECRISGRNAPWQPGANGSVVLPVVASAGASRWEMRW